MSETLSNTEAEHARGFWSEVWRQFRKNRLAMVALVFVFFLSLVALFAPAIAGTKPIVCKYKGKLYYPALGYLNRRSRFSTFVTAKWKPFR